MVIIACVTLVIIIAIILIFLFAKDVVRCDGGFLIGLLGGIFLAVLICTAFNEVNRSIQPIDAYQGKTTLEIIYYRDGVAVDSVIWKEE